MKMDLVKINSSQWLNMHVKEECSGQCPVHAPSDHVMKDFPLYWRDDRGLMERTCPHGIGHPDPDDLHFKQTHMSTEQYRQYAFGVHGCDGCCSGAY